MSTIIQFSLTFAGVKKLMSRREW